MFTVVWSVSLVRDSPTQVWVHPLSAKPGPARILRFYASVGTIVPGQAAQLCYSVVNAKAIRISPMLDGAYPSPDRCIEIHPEHTTHYTLQAVGFDFQSRGGEGVHRRVPEMCPGEDARHLQHQLRLGNRADYHNV